jgi:AAA+ ATPase superfamily predicted ATPase
MPPVRLTDIHQFFDDFRTVINDCVRALVSEEETIESSHLILRRLEQLWRDLFRAREGRLPLIDEEQFRQISTPLNTLISSASHSYDLNRTGENIFLFIRARYRS